MHIMDLDLILGLLKIFHFVIKELLKYEKTEEA